MIFIDRLVWDNWNVEHMTAEDKDSIIRGRHQEIPQFDSREEEANFWDTHDMSDYWDELEPVELKVAKNLSKGITIRFDEETLRELRKRAREKGMGPTTYARMLILEQLRKAS